MSSVSTANSSTTVLPGTYHRGHPTGPLVPLCLTSLTTTLSSSISLSDLKRGTYTQSVPGSQRETRIYLRLRGGPPTTLSRPPNPPSPPPPRRLDLTPTPGDSDPTENLGDHRSDVRLQSGTSEPSPSVETLRLPRGDEGEEGPGAGNRGTDDRPTTRPGRTQKFSHLAPKRRHEGHRLQ